MSGHTFNAGRVYDYKSNCEEMLRVGMSPNIKKKDATNRGKPSIGRAARCSAAGTGGCL